MLQITSNYPGEELSEWGARVMELIAEQGKTQMDIVRALRKRGFRMAAHNFRQLLRGQYVSTKNAERAAVNEILGIADSREAPQ